MQQLKLAIATLLTAYITVVAADSSLALIAVGDIGSKQEASIKHNLNTVGSTFLSSDNIALSFELNIAAEDIGIQSELYLFAVANEQSYMRTTDNNWQLWTSNQPFIATKNLTLQATEQLEVLQGHTLVAGEYQVFAAYKSKTAEIKYTANATTFVVFNADEQALHPITQAEVLRDYLYQGAIHSSYYAGCGAADFCIAELEVMAADTTGLATPTENKTSGTTLQEQGVDEGDRMKTDSDLLFSLRHCENDKSQTCVYSYRLQASPARSTALAFLPLSDKNSAKPEQFYTPTNLGSLYLRTATEAQPRSLIWLNSTNLWQEQTSLYPNWSSYNNQINLRFIQASDPQNLQITQQINLDGELLSSRLVDGVLYLLSRYSSQHYAPYDSQTQAVKPPLDFFLPHYQIDGSTNQSLVDSSQCYIAPQNSARYNAATLSVITAIPVNNPSTLQSRCIAGDLNTFYASSNALYFATSRYPHSVNANQLVYDFATEQVTDIHKFSLQATNLDYRGSGQVTGHLGWEQDKQSFRFGEYNNTLRVASSAGKSWGMDSRTKITVLEEDTENHRLKEISSIDHLGKPGERLYAARFIGNRGYLVTFRTTDPLIVIDFSLAEKPVVMGELEISGYSDYLQPLGEDYLLGIGKDALTDSNGSTWYQGVKLSLFNVSSAENLGLVNSIIIGKRGTESTVLQDHHGLTMLQTEDNHYTIALPIALHTLSPSIELKELATLSTYYNWTHTGLYIFDITTDTAALKHSTTLISESAETTVSYPYYDLINDRAVIQNQTVHYIHAEQVISAEIAGLKQ